MKYGGVEVCGRKFELIKLKDNRTSALSTLTKRMKVMRPLSLSLKNIERVQVEFLCLLK